MDKCLTFECEQLVELWDSIDEPVYISDTETYEILYVNNAIKQLMGDIIGQKCYWAFQGLTSPCLFCTNKYILGENVGKSYIWEFKNKVTNRWYYCIDKAIKLSSGKIVRYEMAIDMAHIKHAEDRLKEVENKFRILFNQVFDILILTDENGGIVDANKVACRTLGYTKTEFLKLSVHDIYPPDEIDKIIDGFNKVLTNGVNFIGETIFITKNRKRIKVEGAGTLHKVKETSYIIGNFRNIAERKQAERALRKSEEKYKALVENANDGIIVAQNRMLKYVNPKVVEFMGYSKEELMSKPFLEFIHTDDRQGFATYNLKKMKDSESSTVHSFKVIDKENNIKWIRSNSIPVTWEGKPAVLSFLSDITKQKKVEDELKLSLVKLQKTIAGNIRAMAIASEMRDPYTAGHQRRVSRLACAIASMMGFPKDQLEGLEVAATLHDIGKMYVPAEILSKPSKLTEIEMNFIKTHSQAGYDILKTEEFSWPVAQIVLQHHERINGTGYPKGIGGDEILLEAKILAVADVVEAMASHRPYRPALGIDKALEEITQNANTLYDPKVVAVCVGLFIKKGFKFD